MAEEHPTLGCHYGARHIVVSNGGATHRSASAVMPSSDYRLISHRREARVLPLLDLIGQSLKSGGHHNQSRPYFWETGATREFPQLGCPI
jgi:hypothetical protein